MAEWLNKYANQSAYDADTRPGHAEVSLIESPKHIVYGGVNVERPQSNPMVGDALYLDSDGGKHFIAGSSLTTTSIPSGWKAAGVVACREGGKVYILDHHDSGTMTFTQGWIHGILGMALSGTQTITFQQFNGSANAEVGTFTTTATSLADFTEELDEWLRGSGHDPNGYNWHAELLTQEDGSSVCVVISDTMSRWERSNSIVKSSSPTGVSGAMYAWNLVGQTTNYQSVLRENGGKGTRPGCNYDRLIEYYSSNAGTSTPTAQVPVDSGSEIMNLATYRDSQYCSNLRAKYGEGETGWRKYMESIMMVWPTRNGNAWNMYGTGKSLTMRMAAFQHKNKSGTLGDSFKAAAWAAKTPTRNSLPASAGLAYGDWYMPDIVEMKKIFGSWSTSASGTQVQKTLGLLGASADARSLAVARWVPARFNYASAWILPSTGSFANTGFSNGNRAVAFALLEL